MLKVVNVVEVMNCDWELWRDFIVYTDATIKFIFTQC